MKAESPTTYHFSNKGLSYSKRYVLPRITEILESLKLSEERKSVFDLGCGNGSTAHALYELGYNVIGVDPSVSGVDLAKAHYPHLDIKAGSAYDDLAKEYGTFPVVVSLEVIEHLYYPRKFINCAWDLLEPGGYFLISTPYHGYWKNLALALTGRMDKHFTVLADDMHIKFFSIKTLSAMLEERGFGVVSFARAGRIPPLAASMIALAKKPI